MNVYICCTGAYGRYNMTSGYPWSTSQFNRSLSLVALVTSKSGRLLLMYLLSTADIAKTNSYWSAFSSGLAETLPIEYDWIWLGKQKDLKSSAALFGQQCVTSGQNSIAHLLSSVLDLLTCFYNILFLAVPLLFLHDICIYICIYIHMRSLLVVQQSQRMLICYLVCSKSAKHVGIGTRFQQIIPRNQPNPAWDSIPQDTQTLGRDKQIGNLWIPIISSHLTRLDFLATLGSSKCPRCSLSSHGTWGHAIAMLGQVY